MQKNLKFFFVQYLQKQFHSLNSCLPGKLQQYPSGTPSPKDAARVFVYPPLDSQRIVLRYPGKVRPLRDLPPNHAVSVLVASSLKGAVWMAVIDVRIPAPAAARVMPSQSWNSLPLSTVIVWNIRRKLKLPSFFSSIFSTATTLD